jgi:hypothetical protein
MKQWNAVLHVGIMALILLSASGCVAVALGGAAAGAGTVMYAQGDLKVTIDQQIDPVYKATKAAVDKMDVMVVDSQHDALVGKIVFRNAYDDKITITLKRTSEDFTDMSIRVGFFGDETKSRAVYDKIKKNL